MRLGILYYGLGLIPEAIAEREKAVALAPSTKWYKYDLAKFYYVDKLYDNAEQQFTALLKIDPGFTLGYYYLAQLYFQKQEYDMAWLSLESARLLGHRGKTCPLNPENRKDSANGQTTRTLILILHARVHNGRRADCPADTDILQTLARQAL